MDETIEQKKKEFLKEQYFLAAWSATVRRNKTWNQITEQISSPSCSTIT